METEYKKNAKKIKTVWAIIIIVVVALISGGIIYFYANNNKLQDDINSISFVSSLRTHKKVQQKTPDALEQRTPAPGSVKK